MAFRIATAATEKDIRSNLCILQGKNAAMNTVHAIYENGVFRPLVPVELPEHTPVSFEVRIEAEPAGSNAPAPALPPGLAKVYAILGERYESGHADTAARHDEHQP